MIEPEITVTCRICHKYEVKDEDDICASCYADSVDWTYERYKEEL